MIKRFLEKNIRKDIGKGKVLIVYGPRRVGKTTLVMSLFNKKETLYLNADEVSVQKKLVPESLKSLERIVGGYKNIIIDEAQRVEEIGLVLKIMIDAHPEWNIVATGSSSFDLNSKIKEPLTGRAYEYLLLPLSSKEIALGMGYDNLSREGLYSRIMTLGSYPGVFIMADFDAERELLTITEKYLYKDTLELAEIRQKGLLEALLKSLASMVGSEVSYQKLASLLGVNTVTIQRYIKLLEDALVIYRVGAVSGSVVNKFSNRKRKIYFYDIGIRNAVLGDMSSPDIRADRGALWENFCMNEFRAVYPKDFTTTNYWRGDYGEVDLIVEHRVVKTAYEFKYVQNNKILRLPKEYLQKYPDIKTHLVTPLNLGEILDNI
jgi:uncharacterized protein